MCGELCQDPAMQLSEGYPCSPLTLCVPFVPAEPRCSPSHPCCSPGPFPMDTAWQPSQGHRHQNADGDNVPRANHHGRGRQPVSPRCQSWLACGEAPPAALALKTACFSCCGI